MPQPEIICRPITASDEEQIVLARNKIFKKNDDLNFLRYFYSSSDKKSLNGLILTTKDNNFIGAMLFVSLKCFYFGQEMPLRIDCDEFIKPDFRKQGYGLFLIQETHNFFLKNGASFGVVSHKYIGPGRLFKVNTYFKKIGLSLKIFNYKKQKIFKNIKIERLFSFNNLTDNIFLKLKEPAASVRIIKDKTYLNWRYLNTPGNPYQAYLVVKNLEVIGYFILENKNKKAYIADLAYQNNNDLETMINIITSWCQKNAYKQVVFVLINELIEKKLMTLGYHLQITDQWIAWAMVINDSSRRSDRHIIYGDLL